MSDADTTAWRQRAERCDDRVRELREQMADMVPRDWHGLMAILDYAYPESIFPTTEDAMTRDPGPRIVSLIRHLDQARAELADAFDQGYRVAYVEHGHEPAVPAFDNPWRPS